MFRKFFSLILILVICTIGCNAKEVKRLTIEKCIDIAKKNNLNYKYQELEFEINKLNEKKARAGFYPTIRGTTNIQKDYDANVAPENGNKYSISLEQPLYHFGHLSHKLRAGRAHRKASLYNLINQEILLEKEVFQAYMNVLKYEKLRMLRKDSMRMVLKQLEKVRELVQSGSRGHEAILRWKVLINSLEDELVETNNDLVNGFINLKRLMEVDLSKAIQIVPYGREDFEADVLDFDVIEDTYSFDRIVDIMFEYAKIFSPEIQKKVEEVRAAKYTLQAERAGNYPKIDLVPKYSADDKAGPEWAYGVRVSFAFLDAADWQEVKIKKKRLKQVELARAIYLRDTKSLIRSYFSKRISSMEQVLIKIRQSEEAIRYLEKITENYNNGKATDVDLIDAYKSYYESRFSEIDSLYNYYIERQKLNALIGYSEYKQTPTIKEFMEEKNKKKFHLVIDIGEGGPIFNAAATSDLKRIRKLLANNSKLVNSANEMGWTPLHFVANTGNLKIAEYLIKKGARIDSRSHIGMTPLYVAATQGNTDVVKFLADHNANVNIPATRNKWTPLMRASKKGFEKIVKILLSAGADVNAKSYIGWTALHAAVEEGSVHITKMLLKYGANPNIGDKKGKIALDLAVVEGREEVVELLERALDRKKKED